jgi:glycosyltransferase involved in cell wall biosynthesis
LNPKQVFLLSIRLYSMSSDLEVDVLLATFNGEKFLKEQLDSLLLQVGVEINLLVGDDGSSDSTLAILATYSNSFKSMEIFTFDRIGVTRNFLTLLRHSKSQFIAFCDQDDVWDSNKILKLAYAIRFVDSPAIAYGKILPFPKSHRVAPYRTTLPRLIHQNSVQGCNLLFNDKLRKHILSLDPSLLVMHDWASVLLCVALGEVLFVPGSHTFYRLHPGNVVGIPRTYERISFSIRGTANREIQRSVYTQANEILSYAQNVSAKNVKPMKRWFDSVTSSPFKRITYSVCMMIQGKVRLQDAIRISLGLFKL